MSDRDSYSDPIMATAVRECAFELLSLFMQQVSSERTSSWFCSSSLFPRRVSCRGQLDTIALVLGRLALPRSGLDILDHQHTSSIGAIRVPGYRRETHGRVRPQCDQTQRCRLASSCFHSSNFGSTW
jgi:hypothetical protein